MEQDELVSHIEELGLSNKESKVYLACLGLGASSVQAIADRAGIKRVTAYVILESLSALGLVAQTIKAKKTYFAPEDPLNLERLLERRANEVSEQISSFRAIFPRLVALGAVKNELPEVKFYDGVEPVRAFFEDFFTTYTGSAKEILVMSNLDEWEGFLPERSTEAIEVRRLEKGISERMLYAAKAGRVAQPVDKKTARISRFVAADKYPLTGYMGILGHCVVLISFDHGRTTGLRIRNSGMASAMKAMFEMAWDLAAVPGEAKA